jgi:hypothetical protein
MKTKLTFLKKDIEENGLIFIKECLENSNFKEISFKSKTFIKIKLDNDLKDEGCEILNQILLENKKIEKIDLSGKLLKNNKS